MRCIRFMRCILWMVAALLLVALDSSPLVAEAGPRTASEQPCPKDEPLKEQGSGGLKLQECTASPRPLSRRLDALRAVPRTLGAVLPGFVQPLRFNAARERFLSAGERSSLRAPLRC